MDCISLDHLDLHRASLTALANVAASQKELCSRVVSDERCIGRLVKLARDSETSQVVRECARLFANLASSLGTKLMEKLPYNQKITFKEVVQKLMKHHCQCIRQHACETNEKAKCCDMAATATTENQQQQPQQQQQQQTNLHAVSAQ